MNRMIRQSLIGALAGGAASAALIATSGHAGVSLLLGATIGAALALSTGPPPWAYLDNIMTAGALGVPLWGILSVITLPLLSGQTPEWSAAQMREHFPAPVGWVLYGVTLGVLVQLLNDVAGRLLGPEPAPQPGIPKPKKRILILGGGFAGMRTAECLEKELQKDPSVSISLVSETNSLLFTPMLAEVAGSSLEPSHISTPLRTTLHRTEFVRGRVTSVDLENKRVALEAGIGGNESCRSELAYDHLVFALGAVSNYLGLTNVQKLAFDFKSLIDAIRIRNHVIEMFERADRESDPSVRRSLLTFVIAGGGFAGVELAGSLSESLGRYAQSRLEARGVEFRLNARLTDARPGMVVLSDGQVNAETLVWTAGTAPNPLTKSLPLEKDKRGAVIVDATLAVPGQAGLWALGDCAAVVDAKSGKPCPPTAQFALREAATLAKNIRASLQGRRARGFHFDSLGALCVVGHQTACAELTIPFMRDKAMRFSGLLAWLMWRGIYLGKLPGLERKIRVLVDWTVELFFPKDIVQTIDLR